MTARRAASVALAAAIACSSARLAWAASPAPPAPPSALPPGTVPAAHPCRLQDEAFEPLGESSGIAVTIERRPVEPRAVRAHVEVHAPAERVLAVVADVPAWPRWIGRIRSLVRLPGEPPAFHVRFGAPWPASDRDYAVLPALDRASLGAPAVFWTTDPTRFPPPTRGVVRVTDLAGGFVVEALEASRSRVTYTERVDPGGSLPAWAVRRSRLRGLAEILTGLAADVFTGSDVAVVNAGDGADGPAGRTVRRGVRGSIIDVMGEPTSPSESWMRQWKAAGPALEEVRRRELRQITDEEALAASEALLSIAPTAPLPRERSESSGLVTQQSLFHRGRRR